jgi:short-subunit dehydrogenase
MKKAIVIGASSGIGRGIAKQLAKQNYKVGITGRRGALLEELKNESRDNFVVKVFDVCDTKSSIENLIQLVQELGGLDLLILSSGTGDINEALDFAIEQRTIDTNVTGFTAIVDWTFNFFANQKAGHLVVISSIAGLRGTRGAPAYNASKAFQINYLEGLQQKAKKMQLPIVLTDVRPGFVDTAMAKGEGQFWVATVDKAVQQIVAAIERKKKVVYITKRWSGIALVLKMIPRWLYVKM